MATRIPLILLTICAGCSNVDAVGTGALELHWQVSPSGCADAGVVAVEVRATGPHAVVERFACESRSSSFEELTPGTYRVELVGFDADGEPIFSSDPVNIDVLADERATSPTLRLLAAPAKVDVRWAFENGRVCGANGANIVAVGAFDAFDYEVATARFNCDLGEGALPPLRAGEYLIEVNALHDRTIVWRGTAPVSLDRAQSVVVDVMLHEGQ